MLDVYWCWIFRLVSVGGLSSENINGELRWVLEEFGRCRARKENRKWRRSSGFTGRRVTDICQGRTCKKLGGHLENLIGKLQQRRTSKWWEDGCGMNEWSVTGLFVEFQRLGLDWNHFDCYIKERAEGVLEKTLVESWMFGVGNFRQEDSGTGFIRYLSRFIVLSLNSLYSSTAFKYILYPSSAFGRYHISDSRHPSLAILISQMPYRASRVWLIFLARISH